MLYSFKTYESPGFCQSVILISPDDQPVSILRTNVERPIPVFPTRHSRSGNQEISITRANQSLPKIQANLGQVASRWLAQPSIQALSPCLYTKHHSWSRRSVLVSTVGLLASLCLSYGLSSIWGGILSYQESCDPLLA